MEYLCLDIAFKGSHTFECLRWSLVILDCVKCINYLITNKKPTDTTPLYLQGLNERRRKTKGAAEGGREERKKKKEKNEMKTHRDRQKRKRERKREKKKILNFIYDFSTLDYVQLNHL